MKTQIAATAATLFLLLSLPLHAQDWGVGASTGPFIFGSFAERGSRIVDSNGNSVDVTSSLSADTSAGGMAHVERFFNDRFSARLDATFTHAPLAVSTEADDDDPVSLEVGEMDVTTIALTGAFRFNRGGRLRPFILAGPAFVIYDVEPNERTGAIPIFRGSRERFALVAGAGLEWWWSDQFAIRGEISDTYSESPLEESDFGGSANRVEIERPHHIHSTVGFTYRF